MLPPLTGRLARNGGHGSIEESEILILSWVAEGFGVVSGRAIFRREWEEKGDFVPAGQSSRPLPFALASQERVPPRKGNSRRARIDRGGRGVPDEIYTLNLENSRVTAPRPPLC